MSRAVAAIFGAASLLGAEKAATAEVPNAALGDARPAVTGDARPVAGGAFGAAVARRSDWTVGVVLERGLHAIVGDAVVDDQLFGLSGTYFAGGRYGLHGRLMISPNTDRFIDTRAVAATGARLRFVVAGVEGFLGLGAHVETRLRTHYWLAYFAPSELGVTAYKKESFRLQVFVGARAVVAGALVDHFLLDPNGVDNEAAREVLAGEKERPWEAYVSLVFARVM